MGSDTVRAAVASEALVGGSLSVADSGHSHRKFTLLEREELALTVRLLHRVICPGDDSEVL